ncbi:thiopeptide-type bacteriocin biosynthesis protein [Micromonospora sp. WMMA1363]|uniref:thiopeptide-type bacteriocin biosynthesis protein n=1 Tax=Micromonospora sp. WMMA1363 TaxID=3053985 RepID=UPI00259D1CC0|nr:thiopeptide-type bacteriocin biosynthesis protein [Micromonospora sp. WMMA1363]MDM4723398.1 thiopeptide-type bacteriocin biosynthesis protein [Micromonospora sp. WMMA1363]
MRKAAHWRLRYLPTSSDAHTYLRNHLDAMCHAQLLTGAIDVVYEPETHAFGGTHAMDIAHRFWHHDSRHLLAHLSATCDQPTTRRRRELTLLLCSTMLRAAGLDWYEQGDVWARVAAHRDPPTPTDDAHLQAAVRRLMTVDTTTLTVPDAALAAAAQWFAGYTSAGRDLARLNASGQLRRGLRDILAHHVIFAWNRLGLPATTQAVLATTATTVVFDGTPAHDRHSGSSAASTDGAVDADPGRRP